MKTSRSPARGPSIQTRDPVTEGLGDEHGVLLGREGHAVGEVQAVGQDLGLPRARVVGEQASVRARLQHVVGEAALEPGRGAVLVDGEAAGAWEMRFAGSGARSRMQVSLDLFDGPAPD